tara:strand:- start:63967 stop:65034 length:1068 start_codon:yes stop_codon:yes gene_type:complete
MLNKPYLFFKFLLLALPFNVMAQIPVSIADIDLVDQSIYDNWTYEGQSFFVVPVKLNEYVELEQIKFNIKYNSNIISPVSNDYFIQINQQEFLDNQGVDDLSLIGQGDFSSEDFTNSSQSLLTISYLGGQLITDNDFADQNGTLVYLAFIKQDPCYEGPILLQFWDGLEEGAYLNPDNTFAVAINEVFTTDNNQVFSIDGSVTLNLLSIELVQDGSSFSVLITDGIPPFTYNWTNKMDQTLSTDNSFSPEETADYLVFVSDSNQCVSALYFSFEQGASIEEQFIAKVGPNPFRDYLNLDFSYDTDYTLFDMSGKIVSQAQNIKSQTIDATSFSKGMYFLKLSNSTQSKVIKLIAK